MKMRMVPWFVAAAMPLPRLACAADSGSRRGPEPADIGIGEAPDNTPLCHFTDAPAARAAR
ncbi:hypothetical protein [Cupriavidus neocaledonicus]|uniref:Uncharacterized protein n=1 Tax=Cupriavidus neocaledonicus TaxID=1040979 RepID=A0A375H5A3_9BURK|nr:hypothetical protein [Cupriavidus neocaledonicus]SOZ34772.1 exported hypothetical protein [Cupriavidus neocaledonicus]SPD46862.1 exported protein of unknown function [Cupriavidus neocaledonicus]